MRVAAELFALFLKSLLRKFWWHIGSNLTIMVSGLCLTGLFAYIFGDFFSSEFSTMHESHLLELRTAIVVLSSVLLGSLSGKWHLASVEGEFSLLPFVKWMGLSSIYQRRYQICLAIFFVCLTIAMSLAVSSFLRPASCILPAVGGLVFQWVGFLVWRLRKAKRELNSPRQIHDWRRHQFLNRAIPGRGLVMLSIFAATALPAAVRMGRGVLIVELLAIVVGLIAAVGLVNAMASDIGGAWFERQAGLSHDEWVQSWQHIANSVALILGLMGCVAVVSSGGSLDISSDWWTLPFLVGFLPWLMPSMVFQIDAGSRHINIMIASMLALFVGTAIMATSWALIAVPIIRTQARLYQRGRFYRAT
jgi:hypothetical protein